MDSRENRLGALEARTRQFALDTLRACRAIPAGSLAGDMARQLGRAVNSVAVNHRAVRRARSMKEFAAKLQVVNEEIDEVVHWLELLHESGLAPHVDLAPLSREGHELRSIFAAARKTARLRMRQ
jgi:four helix bundle protein